MLPLRMLGLLMLMFSLCDSDSSCPTELNPLILDPLKIVENYGESVMVNCSSTVEDHVGMYWSVGNTDTPLEYDNIYIPLSLPLSDWNVTAECKIKLNDTHECSKDLEITLYKIPESVVVFPTNYVAAVEGAPYELQCDVIHVAPVQNLTVRWYKDKRIIRTDSFTNTTKTLGSESSNLAVNISRGEHGAEFRCVAQLDFGPRGPQPPVIVGKYTVPVHYAPELKNKTEDVFVDEGDDVALTCEAEGRPSPDFQWTCDETNITSENTNNVNITRVTTSGTCSCTATNYLGNITKQFYVHVKIIPAAAPAALTTPEASTPRGCPLVLTPAEIVVRFGDPVSVNCSTSAADVSKMGWEATSGGTMSRDSSVTWRVAKLEDWTIIPLCFMNFKDNSQCSKMLPITLYKTPDRMSVSAVDPVPMVEGTDYPLKCDIINVAPVQMLKVTWYRGTDAVLTHMYNDTSKIPVNVSSTLIVTPERDHNGALFRCVTELHLGPKGPEPAPNMTSLPYMANVHYKPRITACPDHYAGVEHEFSMDNFSCQADGNPLPTVQWYYEGKLINASEPLTRNQSGTYTAKVANRLGSSSTSVDITIEYGPSFSCDTRYEVEENGKIPCEPTGIPKPAITGEKNGIHLMTFPQHWTKHDSGTYNLTARNKHGSASHILYVDVLYVPIFNEVTYNKEVNPGENVTFDCSAEGNPPPDIHWNFSSAVNVMEITRGRQKSISITGATSTNAGVYICVATNKVGTVTRSVTLMLKGKANAGHTRIIWWILIMLIIVLIIFVLVLMFQNCRKKHGQYSFVPDTANDGSGIPMTPQSNGVA